ncbi:UNVERIFIED_CONTAM: hypothetical protein Slati_3501000 [Sesamum latifolium]|uniref:DUF4218 domain-containing protein n=1 Tax=Sesamum latifolium TaxID=2727402 RepID=A0AAW2UH95_9LAMI
MKELRLHSMKSHDCYIFTQKLIPIAFREMLPVSVWSALTEVSLLFQIICSTTLDVVKVQELEDKVAIILCNLEKIFPPSFFDSMEHLNIHLPYEAHVGGPVQYSWMYPFERFLRGLKMKVKNKAHVEASIVEAYLVEEISIFTSQYFEPQVLCKWNRPSRNDDLAMNDTRIQQFIFNFPGREFYVYRSFFNELYEHYDSEDPIIEELVATQFKDWFKCRVKDEISYTCNELLKLHYWGPTAEVTTFPCYFMNGYNFHTERHSVGKSTFNYGVCVKNASYTDTDSDFYGILEEPEESWMTPVGLKCHFKKMSQYLPLQENRAPEMDFSDNGNNYALLDPNGTQLVVDLNQQGADTSRRQMVNRTTNLTKIASTRITR